MPNSASKESIEESRVEQFLVANHLKIAYEEFGNADHPPIVLVMGLGTQMIAWPDEFCQGFADKGYRVIRFDNRDIGLSEKILVDRPVSIPRLLLKARFGLSMNVPYTLEDMAQDTVGVMDSLDIESAHIVGASMGGMIAQITTGLFSSRVRSLTSIMSTTGNPKLPGTRPSAARRMLVRPDSSNEDSVVEHGIKTWAIIGSPDFKPSQDELRARLLRGIRRSYYPAGYRNQFAAIIENGDRRELLSTIDKPTLVIHGKEDVLIPVQGGIDTADCIAGAKLKIYEGMGHDLPRQLVPRFVQLIDDHIRNAE